MKLPQITGLLALALLLIARGAGAAPAIELIWAGTSGSGTPGSDTMVAETGDFVVLDMFVVADCDVIFTASVSMTWDPSVLIGINAEECPSPTNTVFGICEDSQGVGMFPPFLGVSLSPGEALGFDVWNFPGPNGFYCETMHLGRLDFIVGNQGDSTVQMYYRENTDYIADGSFDLHYPAATAYLKEPVGCF